jgi:hypothetical protein
MAQIAGRISVVDTLAGDRWTCVRHFLRKQFTDGCSATPRHRLLMGPRSVTTRGASSHAPIEIAEPVQRSRC